MTSQVPHSTAHALAAGPMRRVLLIRLVVNLVAPVLVYLLLRPHLHSDITALVIGAAVPTAYIAGVLLWRRRWDPIGVFAIACFAFGLLLAIATHGNELVFKLREDIWTGPVGLICLISVAVRRPLFLLGLQLAARRNPALAHRISRPEVPRIATVTTAVIGALLLIHAIAMVVLAYTTSTTTFLAVSRPISLTMIGLGLAGLIWWIRHQVPDRGVGTPDANSSQM